MNQQFRTLLPLAIIPVLILAAVIVGLPVSSANNDAPAAPVAAAQNDAATPIVVTVEVTRIVTVIVTPTFTPLPPTATPLPPDLTVDDDNYLGSADALVKVVEFSDYQCGFCARFYTETLFPLLDRYGDKIQFVYRDFPIFGDASVLGALGAECAGDQGKFWEYHNTIFDDHTSDAPSELTYETYLKWAGDLGLDVEAWAGCVNNPATLNEVSLDAISGQDWGITGTPTFFINGKKLVGAHPFETFVQLIDAELVTMGVEPPPPLVTTSSE